MAFTLEDGTGIAEANSYMSVAEFKTYHNDRGNVINDLGGDGGIQQALIRGTDYIEQRWGTLFMGSREFDEQPLAFPRVNLYDRDGDLVQGIPDRLKFALAEYALQAKSSALFLEPTVDATGLRIRRQKIGPIEQEFMPGDIPKTTRSLPAADKWLQEYVVPGGRTMRG